LSGIIVILKLKHQWLSDVNFNMKTVRVHKFNMGDVEDVELYVAEPLYQFEMSEKGQWVMQNALEPPIWNQRFVQDAYYYIITIDAKFTDEMATFFQLKWGNK